MMDVSSSKALTLEVLFQAVAKLPLSTTIYFDKIFGRWIFTNQDQDDWPKMIRKAHKVAGPNFTFVDDVLEMALARGIYYYYHTKICENEK